jgi:hypothetical protein
MFPLFTTIFPPVRPRVPFTVLAGGVVWEKAMPPITSAKNEKNTIFFIVPS